jgi:NAD-dependent deacetylase
MRILIFSGAGLSAESGVSTFRDANGLWENHKIEEVCTFDTWEQNYELVHKFYNERRVQLKETKPNEAHKIIAKIQKEFCEDNVTIITQNVDDLLEQAGCVDVLHVHGRLDYIHCTACNTEYKCNYNPVNNGKICTECGNDKFKPSIIFFGENCPNYHFMYRSFSSLTEDDIVIVIGTDGSVVPIDYILTERYNGYTNGTQATKVLVNLNHSDFIKSSNYNWVYKERATEALPKIYELLKKKYKK